MFNRQPCVTDDSYQLSYEHLRQLECSSHFRPSPPEVSPFNFVSGRQQVPDGEKVCHDSRADEASFGAGDYHTCPVVQDIEFRLRTDDIVFTASVFDRALNSSLASQSSFEPAAVENAKRPLSHFCDEAASKRARQEDEAAKLEHFDGNSFVVLPAEGKLSEEAEWAKATAGAGADVKNCEAGYVVTQQITVSDQPEDVHFKFPDHSHWRNVPIGPDHQADLPKCASRDSSIASGDATTSYAGDDGASDKWLGSCVMPMPPDRCSFSMEVQCRYSEIGCDCANEGSINCVRKHVMEAREGLAGALRAEEFMQMGFSHMGEIVAHRWTEEEENLFDLVVSSNRESAGRNFWMVLRKAFPSSSFKELVSYYFNVFVLRKRARQNRLDRSNADSDNDEWQERSDVEFEGEGDEAESEPPSPGKILKNDAAEAECEERPHSAGGAGEEPKSNLMPAVRTVDGNSTGCPEGLTGKL